MLKTAARKPDTLPSAPHHTDNLKTKAPNTTGSSHLYNTLDLLMMGIMVPETCWASNKICNKNHLLHLVGILFPHIKYMNWFYLHFVSEIFSILKKIQRNNVINLHTSSCKVPVILSYFNENLIFSTHFRKKILKYQISWKSVQWEPSCSMRTDGQTGRQRGMTKLTLASSIFAKAPTKRNHEQ